MNRCSGQLVTDKLADLYILNDVSEVLGLLWFPDMHVQCSDCKDYISSIYALITKRTDSKHADHMVS